jgi:hypothetical protein
LQVPVYQFKEVEFDSEYANALGKKLKLNGEAKLDPEGHKYYIKEGQKNLVLEKLTGKIIYFDESKQAMDPSYLSKNIPSDEDVIEIAKNFLTNLNLLPNNFKLVGVAPITVTPGTDNPETVGAIIVAKKVFFYKQINNKDVLGVSRITVTVGSNGEIIGFGKHYKDAKEYAMYPIKTVNQALGEVKNNHALTNIDEKAEKAKINKVEINYWEDPGAEQPYLQPVYVFIGEAKVGDRWEVFKSVIPAIKD